MKIKSKGFCLIEVITAISILIIAINTYLYVQIKVDRGLENAKREADIYVCTNSFYNYLNSCTEDEILSLGGRRINLENLLGKTFSNFFATVKFKTQKYSNVLGNEYTSKILCVDIYMGNKVIEHYNLIKEI